MSPRADESPVYNQLTRAHQPWPPTTVFMYGCKFSVPMAEHADSLFRQERCHHVHSISMYIHVEMAKYHREVLGS